MKMLNESVTAYKQHESLAKANYALSKFHHDPLYIVVPISIIYAVIFFTGLIGNVSTCVVIARNKCMHTATNYYLFSLAISDLLLLISGLPPEIYYIWSNFPYIFGETFCIVQSFAAETSANATVLTITAFTVERYVAICHPFLSHTMSKLSRAVKYVIAIWLLALCLAIPQAIQFGIVYRRHDDGTVVEGSAVCSIKWTFTDHAFAVSTVLFFVLPMSIITVLYVLIGLKLRNSHLLLSAKRNPPRHWSLAHSDSTKAKSSAQKNVIRMLVAVVAAFFICWAPFHTQRLLAVYAENNKKDGQTTAIVLPVYTVITYISGVFYYISTTINPLLYNIMSNKFREAFKAMLSKHCGRRRVEKSGAQRPTYSSLSRYPRSTTHRADPQLSASLSVSEESKKLAQIIESAAGASPDQLQLYNSYYPLAQRNETSQRERPREEQRNEPTTSQPQADPPLHYELLSNETRSPNLASGTLKSWKLLRRFDKNGRNRSRLDSSNYSQAVATTSFSTLINEGNNNEKGCSCVYRCSTKSHRHYFGNLVEEVKCDTEVYLNAKPSSENLQGLMMDTDSLNTLGTRTSWTAQMQEPVSAHCECEASGENSDSISNSSLQDFDKTEFTSKELSLFVEEINCADHF